MRVRSRSTDGRARHFFHTDGIGGGDSGGNTCETVAESDLHLKWKSLAASKLAQEFDIGSEEPEIEKEVDAPNSENDRRIADVFMGFSEPDEQLGEAIIIEVQHKNVNKNIPDTTSDYISQNYSVVWLFSDDFSGDRCKLNSKDFRNRAMESAWPEFVPEQSNWRPVANNHSEVKEDMQRAVENGLVRSGTPATLPTEWVDEISKEIWERQSWEKLFNNPHNRDEQDYIDGLKDDLDLPHRDRITVRMPLEFVAEIARSIWENQDWSELFPDAKTPSVEESNVEYQYQSHIKETQKDLSRPDAEIDFWRMYSRNRIKAWWLSGLNERDDTLPELPPIEEWGGLSYTTQANANPSINVKFPHRFYGSIREELKSIWEYHTGSLELDIAKKLTNNNATRKCEICGSEADFYLKNESPAISEFRCANHASKLSDNIEY
jgi:hypothetical protein